LFDNNVSINGSPLFTFVRIPIRSLRSLTSELGYLEFDVFPGCPAACLFFLVGYAFVKPAKRNCNSGFSPSGLWFWAPALRRLLLLHAQ